MCGGGVSASGTGQETPVVKIHSLKTHISMQFCFIDTFILFKVFFIRKKNKTNTVYDLKIGFLE